MVPILARRADHHRGARRDRAARAAAEIDHLGLSVLLPGRDRHGEGPDLARSDPARPDADLVGDARARCSGSCAGRPRCRSCSRASRSPSPSRWSAPSSRELPTGARGRHRRAAAGRLLLRPDRADLGGAGRGRRAVAGDWSASSVWSSGRDPAHGSAADGAAQTPARPSRRRAALLALAFVLPLGSRRPAAIAASASGAAAAGRRRCCSCWRPGRRSAGVADRHWPGSIPAAVTLAGCCTIPASRASAGSASGCSCSRPGSPPPGRRPRWPRSSRDRTLRHVHRLAGPAAVRRLPCSISGRSRCAASACRRCCCRRRARPRSRFAASLPTLARRLRPDLRRAACWPAT